MVMSEIVAEEVIAESVTGVHIITACRTVQVCAFWIALHNVVFQTKACIWNVTTQAY